MNAEAQAATKAYDTFGSVYDFFFSHSLSEGRKLAINCMRQNKGDRILEVGVGTGLSLPYYPNDVRITGIDVSVEMLNKAKKRVERHSLNNVDELVSMDAHTMEYEDNSFDSVVLMYIMGVVPDPIRVMEEVNRVCRPGGDIIVLNYLRTGDKQFRLNEWIVKPLGKMFHFRFGLSVEDLVEQAKLNVIQTFRTNIFSHTTVLHCRKDGGVE